MLKGGGGGYRRQYFDNRWKPTVWLKAREGNVFITGEKPTIWHEAREVCKMELSQTLNMASLGWFWPSLLSDYDEIQG